MLIIWIIVSIIGNTVMQNNMSSIRGWNTCHETYETLSAVIMERVFDSMRC